MSELCKETLCTNCIHCSICSIKADYLKIFETLPKHDDNFSLKVCCKHYFEYNTTKFSNSITSGPINGLVNYDTTTGNPLRNKIDI